MKDNWIKAFQDKLGDYEMDVPVVVPRRPVARLWPLIPAAAAAAALLFFTLRTPESVPGAASHAELADAAVTLLTDVPSLPTASLLPERTVSVRPSQSARPGTAVRETGAKAQTAVDANADSDEDGSGKVSGNTLPTDTDTQAPSAAADEADGVLRTELPELFLPEEGLRPQRRHTSLSAQVHVTPLSAQQFTAPYRTNGADYMFMRHNTAYMFSDAVTATPSHTPNLSYELTTFDESIARENEVRCYLPAKTGISLRIETGTRFWIESGLGYSLHRATAENSSPVLPSFVKEYRMHYLGIPLHAGVRIAERDQMQLYAVAGGEAEMMLGGTLRSLNNSKIQSERITERPALFSLTGALGAEYDFTRFLGIYAEPGVSWHFKPKGNLPNYYREHPFSFDLHIGLRFHIGSASDR